MILPSLMTIVGTGLSFSKRDFPSISILTMIHVPSSSANLSFGWSPAWQMLHARTATKKAVIARIMIVFPSSVAWGSYFGVANVNPFTVALRSLVSLRLTAVTIIGSVFGRIYRRLKAVIQQSPFLWSQKGLLKLD